MHVIKFGGSSLATAHNILLAKSIVQDSLLRSFVVVSAPGTEKGSAEQKVTDMLIEGQIDKVFSRFKDIAAELEKLTGKSLNFDAVLETVSKQIRTNTDRDFIVSRGEYLTAILFARVLDYKFLDAADYIMIKKNGLADIEQTRKNFAELAAGGCYVMGGFYGYSAEKPVKNSPKVKLFPRGRSDSDCASETSNRHMSGGNKVRLFSRGGSDYSGAVAAVCLGAELYEVFTDTFGVQSANPALVANTKSIPQIDYTALHRLSTAGATVIYPNCLPLLARHSVPLRVDNTFSHGVKSTLVTGKKPTVPYFSITYDKCEEPTMQILCLLSKVPKETIEQAVKVLHEYLSRQI